MTREEAIKQLEFMLEQMPEEPPTECDYIDEWLDTNRKIRNTLDMAIKALEQELCEDSVSRQEVIDTIFAECSGEKLDIDFAKVLLLQRAIKALPSTTPIRKKGKWINRSSTSGCGIRFVASECSCCNKKTFFDCDQLVYRYCPNCGAEMEGEE